ncbi:hypothetical protein THH46_14805 [Pseudomonas sp. NA13]
MNTLTQVLRSGLASAIERQADIDAFIEPGELAARFPSEAWVSSWAIDILADLRVAATPRRGRRSSRNCWMWCGGRLFSSWPRVTGRRVGWPV